MLDINNNRMILNPEGKNISTKELKEKIKGLELLGLKVKHINIKFNLLDIEEIKEGDAKALELYNKSINNELEIIEIKNKKVKFENGISLTLDKQIINYIKIEY